MRDKQRADCFRKADRTRELAELENEQFG